MSRFKLMDSSYDFFVNKKNSSFTAKELKEAGGWGATTLNTHVSKKLKQFITRDGNKYFVQNLPDKTTFRKILSQKRDVQKDNILLRKAKEFARLAVATYNNPFTELKTYGYIVNIVIAFTALFQAIFEKRGQDYYHLDHNNDYILIDGDKKAWELSECCRKYWQNDCAEKANLNFLIGLRNKIEHRGLPALDLLVNGECQAALNNFEKILFNEFGSEHSLLTSLAISMQLTKISQNAQIAAMKELQSSNYKIIKEYMEDFKSSLSEEILESQNYRIRVFLIPAIGNHASSSDLMVEFVNYDKLKPEDMENYKHLVAFIKEHKRYRHRPGKVVDRIKIKISEFDMYMHTKCWKYYNARPQKIQNFKGEYCSYDDDHDTYLYTEKWINFLLEKLADPEKYKKIKEYKP